MLLQFPVHRGQQGILATTIKRKHYFATIDVFHSFSLHFLHKKNVCENSIISISCPIGETLQKAQQWTRELSSFARALNKLNSHLSSKCENAVVKLLPSS